MDPALVLAAEAAKLSTVPSIGLAVTVIGALSCLAGWVWLIYQNGRFGVVHGVLSFLIPLYALIFAFVGLEHAEKSRWTTMFLAGAVIAGLGYALVFAAQDCENNPNCGLRIESIEQTRQQTSAPDDSSALPPDSTPPTVAHTIE